MAPLRDEAIHAAEGAAPFFCEFLGSFFVVLTYGLNVLSGSMLWSTTSVAFAVMAAMVATVDISGGHLNPAITLAHTLSQKMGWVRALGYWIAQFTGGLLAGSLSTSMAGGKITVAPRYSFDAADLLVSEVVFTSFICFVALNSMAAIRITRKRLQSRFAPLAVGFAYLAAGQATIEISGGFANPAATLAFAVTEHPEDWKWLNIYVGCQALGSAVAALLFFMVRPEEFMAFGHFDSEGLELRRAISVLCPWCYGAAEAPGRGENDDGSDEMARDQEHQQRRPHAATQEEALESYLGKYESPWPCRHLSEFLGCFFVVATFTLSIANSKLVRHTYGLTDDEYSATNTTKSLGSGAQAGQHGEGLRAGVYLGGNTTALATQFQMEAAQLGLASHWSTAAAVIALSLSLADVSGAHFNPAVTLASALSRPGMWRTAESLPIMMWQLLGGILAAAMYATLSRNHSNEGLTELKLEPGNDHRLRSVIFGEMVFTAAVALVVTSVTMVKSPRYPRAPSIERISFALAIGFVVAAAGISIHAHTGGILNPCIAVGITAANIFTQVTKSMDLQGLVGHIGYLFYFVGWEMVGGVLAAIVFVLAHPLEYKKDPLLVN